MDEIDEFLGRIMRGEDTNWEDIKIPECNKTYSEYKSLPKTNCNIPIPPVRPPKKESKIKRVYEDDTWVIDLIDGNVIVSYFEDGHFVDEIILSGDDFKG